MSMRKEKDIYIYIYVCICTCIHYYTQSHWCMYYLSSARECELLAHVLHGFSRVLFRYRAQRIQGAKCSMRAPFNVRVRFSASSSATKKTKRKLILAPTRRSSHPRLIYGFAPPQHGNKFSLSSDLGVKLGPVGQLQVDMHSGMQVYGPTSTQVFRYIGVRVLRA